MIVTALCIAYAIFFLHVTTWDGHIFNKVDKWFENAPDWIRKPLFDCPICMSPWYGMLFQLILFPAHFLEMFFTCMIAGGINVLNVIAAKAYDIMTDEND